MTNIYLIRIQEGKERENGVEKKSEKKSWKISKFSEGKFTHARNSANIKLDKCKENPSRHIIVKLLKAKDKERILKAAREKWYIICRGIMIKISVDFSSEIMQAKNKWHVIFTMLNRNKQTKNPVDPEFYNQWKYPSGIKVK